VGINLSIKRRTKETKMKTFAKVAQGAMIGAVMMAGAAVAATPASAAVSVGIGIGGPAYYGGYYAPRYSCDPYSYYYNPYRCGYGPAYYGPAYYGPSISFGFGGYHGYRGGYRGGYHGGYHHR
jgi:hypothetical protein